MVITNVYEKDTSIKYAQYDDGDELSNIDSDKFNE